MASNENELPIRLVIVNREEIDQQLTQISRDRSVSGGGGGRSSGSGGGGGPIPLRGGVSRGGGNVSAGIVEGASGVGTAAALRGGAVGGAAGGGVGGALSRLGGGSALAGAGVAGAVTVVLSEIKKNLQTISKSVVNSLDPNQTRGQRQLSAARGLSGAASLVGGGIFRRGFEAAEPFIQAGVGAQLRTEQASAASATARFDAAFEGIGLANPNASVSELEKIIKTKLGKDIDAISGDEGARARGREAGRQVVTQATGGAIDVGEASTQIRQQVKSLVGDVRDIIRQAFSDDVKEASGKLKDAAEKLQQSVDSQTRITPGRTR